MSSLTAQPIAPPVIAPAPPALTGRKRSWSVRTVALVALAVALVLVAVASVAFGARGVTWADIVAGVSGSQETLAEAAVSQRVPRTLLALVVGAALGVSGALMQGVSRNPLADPGIFGINNGAALFVVIGMTFFNMTDQYAVHLGRTGRSRRDRGLRLPGRLPGPWGHDPAQARPRRRRDVDRTELARVRRHPSARRGHGFVPLLADRRRGRRRVRHDRPRGPVPPRRLRAGARERARAQLAGARR